MIKGYVQKAEFRNQVPKVFVASQSDECWPALPIKILKIEKEN